MNWNWETLKSDFSLANSWFKDREKVFCIVTGLWLEMKSKYSMTTPRRKNTTLSPVNRCLNINTTAEHSWFEDHLYIWWDLQKGLIYYELLKPGDSITGDRYRSTIDSFEPCIARKNGRNTSKDMIKLFFFMTTLGLMSLK